MICEEHHGYGSLPCPWPDCKNGILEDEFRLEPIFTLVEKENIYGRKQWFAPSGDAYYSWVSDSILPSWFQADRIVGREAVLRGMRVRPQNTLIYHYTTLQGLKGILESQEMWFTDYGYLNDSDELEHGLQLFEEKLKVAIGRKEYADVAGIFEAWIENMRNHQHRICIASYSLDGDSLSQWRAYGSVAIGFAPSYELTGSRGECRFDSVIYDHANQERLVEFFLHHILQSFRHDMANAEAWKRLNIKEIYQGGVYQLVSMSALFKNEGFADEREVRVAYVENPDLFEKLSIEPAQKRFRATAEAIIPYVTSADISHMDEKLTLPIREIVVGPAISEVGKKSIREFLDHLGLNKVDVRSSKVPYRR